MRRQANACDPRAAALQVIRDTEGGEDLQQALNRLLSRSPHTPQDRHLCTQICYGYFRYKGRLEFILGRYIQRKWRKLPRPMTRALGLAAYELLFLDRVPQYATVSWYVRYINRKTSKQLAGVANAVLRRLADSEGDALHDPEFFAEAGNDAALFLSRWYSCPEWMARLWLAEQGREESEKLLQASLQQPPVGLRINQAMPEGETVLSGLVQSRECLAELGFGLALTRSPGPFLDELLAKGLVSRQSLAAQEALKALKPEGWDEPVWEACAGRGGKTAMLREMGVEQLWASDKDMVRLAGLRSELERLHLPGVPIFCADASQSFPIRRSPASLLLDVPCSGLGVISRRPDLKWKRCPEDVANLAGLQARMLRNAGAALPSKGRIAFMTCTVTHQENRNQVQRFLRENPDWEMELEWQTESGSRLAEFFYVASLRRKKVAVQLYSHDFRSGSGRQNQTGCL